MKLKKLKIVNKQNHFRNRNHKECKQYIRHAMRRFANMFSAVAERKALLFGVNPAVAERKMPIFSVNAADCNCSVPIRCVNAAVS